MKRNIKRFYAFSLLVFILGFSWVYLFLTNNEINKNFVVCIFKQTTSLPCPSCGVTRSVISLAKGQIYNAILINPLGILVASLMLLLPLLFIFDIITKEKTLYKFFLKIERIKNKPKIIITLFLLILFNWIWNIAKGL